MNPQEQSARKGPAVVTKAGLTTMAPVANEGATSVPVEIHAKDFGFSEHEAKEDGTLNLTDLPPKAKVLVLLVTGKNLRVSRPPSALIGKGQQRHTLVLVKDLPA